jgi:hypothetical protein
MSEEGIEEIIVADYEKCIDGVTGCQTSIKKHSEAKKNVRGKRDIIRFNGATPIAINLDHVTLISFEGKRVTFEIYAKAQYIECEDEEAAAKIFEAVLNIWSTGTETQGINNEV